MLDNHNINIMSNITKKQTSLALIAVVFATAMIVGTLASAADNKAFARIQSIDQKNSNSQSTSCNSSGGSAISIRWLQRALQQVEQVEQLQDVQTLIPTTMSILVAILINNK